MPFLVGGLGKLLCVRIHQILQCSLAHPMLIGDVQAVLVGSILLNVA